MADEPKDIPSFAGGNPNADELAKGENKFMGQATSVRSGISGFAGEYLDRYKYLKNRIKVWEKRSMLFGMLIILSTLWYPVAHQFLFPEVYFSLNPPFWLYVIGKITLLGLWIGLLSWSLKNMGRVRRLLAVYKDRQIIAQTYDKILQSDDEKLIDKATDYVFKEIFSCAPLQALEKSSNNGSPFSFDDIIKLLSIYQKQH